MDPVKILDHYRLPLVHSRDAIQVLARLLRDGPQALAGLAKSLQSVPPETDRQLTSLYRAALVKKLGADLWSVSPLGEHVLAGLHVVEIAAADLAESLADTESDRLFFRTWLQRPTRYRDSQTCLSLFRSLRQVQESEVSWHGTPKVSQSPIRYAIVFAADSGVQYTGVENVYEALMLGDALGDAARFLEARSDETGTGHRDDTIAAAWKAGMKHYRDSNRLLLFIPHEPPVQTDQDTLRFTWLRAVDAAMRGSADEGLRVSCSLWRPDDAAVFWKFMFKQRLVERQTRVLCRQQGWLDQPSLTEDLLAGLVKRMMEAIGDTSRGEPLEPSRIGVSTIGDEFHDLVDRLGRASHRVEHEGIGVIPDGVRGALSGALEHLSSILREPSADPEAG